MTIAVSWNPTYTYANDPTTKAKYTADVENAIAPQGAVSAVIMGGAHTSRSDRRNHLTVDYYGVNGNKIKRVHIPV
ncbi:hypothetical protein FRC12_022178 [Ceratobasidium sp. 428]|nr:hypothetical protein FRC09_019706 [Ceratobasidium sp. 395]KAG8727849.1 hypothetical protein FRC12_022178 [Ceratobasidium sp. 428]